MTGLDKHLIKKNTTIKEALSKLDFLGKDAILFLVDDNNKLKGALTDGDIRRGLLKGFLLNNLVTEIVQPSPKFILKSEYNIEKVKNYRDNNYKIIPIIDEYGVVVKLLNFRLLKSYLPIDVVIMAGGKGSRLKPLTNDTPKPLLNVGNKPIIEHNIDQILSYGVESFWISINYLGDKIVKYFGQGIEKNININYVKETTPLGTIGAVSKIHDFRHDYVLITNSDILTNLDYEKFYIDFIEKEADLSIIGIPYKVNIPYAVLEKDNDGNLINFKEKPEYTYESNGGIYLIKKTYLNLIPENLFFNATDLIEKLISQNKKVITYPFNGYWLDIGKHDDYNKAQKDIDNINFT